MRLLLALGLTLPCRATAFECAGYEPPHVEHGVAAKAVKERLRSQRGAPHVLVVFAKFKNEQPSVTTAPDFAADLFDADLPGSLSHFFHTMSFGQLELSGTALRRRYESKRSATAYLSPDPKEEGQFPTFAAEVMRAVDRDVDFTLFDNDGADGIANSGDDDGMVDYVFMSVLTTPRNFIRGGATGVAGFRFEDPLPTRDIGKNGQPILIDGGIMAASLIREGTFSRTVGTMAHEFAHSFGLPDLYDVAYTDPAEDSAGIGRWGLMGWGAHGWTGDDGPNPLSIWSLEQLGWVGENNERLMEVADDARGLVVEDIFNGGLAYKVPITVPLEQKSILDHPQYLLIERRSAGFYGRNRPADGILVWRAGTSSSNRDEGKKVVDLVCADGLYRDAGFPLGSRPDGTHGKDNLDFWAHNGPYRDEHRGNLGDDTDPFDGRRFQRLHLDSNPSTDFGGLPSSSTGSSFAIEKAGDTMLLSVSQPRWAGTIDQRVFWTGRVRVAGDVRVAPEGVLTIMGRTEVLFASGDSIATGVDPNQCELSIEGSLVLRRWVQGEQVLFTTSDPEAKWHGIRLTPRKGSVIDLPDGSYEIRNAEAGMVFTNAPATLDGDFSIDIGLIDGQTLDTAGNQDGQLGPGETVRLVAEMTNWTAATRRNASARLKWLNSLFTKSPGTLRSANLYPGVPTEWVSDVMQLSPDATAGAADLVLSLSDGRQDTVSFPIQGSYPSHRAWIEAPSQQFRGSSARMRSDRTLPLRVRVEGDINQGDLVVRTIRRQEPVASVPLTYEGTEGIYHILSAEFKHDEPGLFKLSPRLGSPGNEVVASDASLNVWVHGPHDELPMLAFVTGGADVMLEPLESAAARYGQTLHVERPKNSEEFYEALLPHYAGGAQARPPILWLGGDLNRRAAMALETFLLRGGRLLAISRKFAQGVVSYMPEMPYIESVSPMRASGVRALGIDAMPGFTASHMAMQLRAPAVPMFRNEGGELTGLLLDNGTSRLALVPFQPRVIPEESRLPLIQRMMAFLDGATTEAALELPGEPSAYSVSAQAEVPTAVRARVKGAAAQAHLTIGVRSHLDSTQTVPMNVISEGDGETVFEASFVPAEAEKYSLTLELLDERGREITNTAHLGVMGVSNAADALVLYYADGQAAVEKSAPTRRAMAQTLESTGRVPFFANEAETGEFRDGLLSRYTGPDKLVISLGLLLNRNNRWAIERFLEEGGRLLSMSGTVSSQERSDFTRRVMRVAKSGWGKTARIYTEGLLPEAGIDTTFRHAASMIFAPAVPIIGSENHGAVGWFVQNGTSEWAHVAIGAEKLNPTQQTSLLRAVLSAFGRTVDAQLEFPGHERIGTSILATPGAEMVVRARVGPEVVAVNLMVWPNDEMVQMRHTRMVRAGKGLFETVFTPGYKSSVIAAQVTTARGDQYASGQSAMIAPYLTENPSEALVFRLSQGYSKATAAVSEVLGDMGLTASVINNPLPDPELIEALFRHRLRDDGVVVWLGSELTGPDASILARHLDAGGRLLLTAGNFTQEVTAQNFLSEYLGILRQDRSSASSHVVSGVGRRAVGVQMRYRPMELSTQAQPLLRNAEGSAVAAKIETEQYRAVLLPFNPVPPVKVGEEFARNVLEQSLRFLTGEETPNERVIELHEVVGPGAVTRSGTIEPQIVVGNASEGVSLAFRVGYEVHHGDSLVARFEQIEPALAAGEDRVITLAGWEQLVEADLFLRIGLGDGDGELTYGPRRRLHVVHGLQQFVERPLPVDSDRSNGIGVFDYDSDGDADVYLARTGSPNLLFRNDGGSFSEQAANAGLADSSGSRGMAMADYDGDGLVDLYLANAPGANRLFRNVGSGAFEEVTDSAHVAAPQHAVADEGQGRSAGFLDGDGDGDLDLYLVNRKGSNRYYENDAGTFVDNTAAMGLEDEGDGRGLAFADVDGDLDTDLFVASLDGGKLFRNGDHGFEQVTVGSGITRAGGEVGAVFADYDNDGDVDLFVSNQSGMNHLYRNTGDSFEQVTSEDSLYLGSGSVGAALFDVDNDGDLDLATTAISATHGGDELYQNRNGFLVPVGGLLELTPSSRGRGLTHADVDNDGDWDLFVADASRSRLYENQSSGSNWLQVRLRNSGPNRDGLGAVVEVSAQGQRQRRQVQSVFGYTSQREPLVHLGLGTAENIDTLRVLWPDGEVVTLDGTDINQVLTVVRGIPAALGIRGGVPAEFELRAAYPNPFNAQVVIPFDVPEDSQVRLEVYDVIGQRVRTLVDSELPSGRYHKKWDGRNGSGASVASGVYFVKLTGVGFVQTRRVLLLQ